MEIVEVGQILEKISNLINASRDFISQEAESELKVLTYKQMMEDKELNVDSYGDLVNRYGIVQNKVALIAKANSDLQLLRGVILENSGKFGMSLSKSYMSKVDILIKSCQEWKSVLLGVKDKYDTMIRFYQSTNYMLYNSRMQDLTTYH